MYFRMLNSLFDAIRKGKFHLARFILEASQGDLPNSADIRGKTPLIIACSIKVCILNIF